MYAIMVNGKVNYMTSSASKAESMMGMTVAVLYPQADWRRAARTFKAGNPVTIGNISGLI